MALVDWQIYTLYYDDLRRLGLSADRAFEGSKSLFIDADESWLVHDQTLTDKPLSGAVKTYFLFPYSVRSGAGAVFKADLNGNCLAIFIYEPNGYEIFQYTRGIFKSLKDGSLNTTLQKEVWYILEVICDDENNKITIRIKDDAENVLDELILSNIIPADLLTRRGGIGLFAWSNGVYYDLTKIYYP